MHVSFVHKLDALGTEDGAPDEVGVPEGRSCGILHTQYTSEPSEQSMSRFATATYLKLGKYRTLPFQTSYEKASRSIS